jgi:preprotein translocase subunit SecY
MKNLIATLKNIWSIKELRDRILLTLLFLGVYRIGSFIVLPGVLPKILENAYAKQNANDLLGLINVFTGGAFSNASVFALGVMPYITASIVVQLLGFAVPYFQRLQQHEGESGRKKLNQITRILTVAITLVQGGAYLTYLKTAGAVDPRIPTGIFWFSNIIIMAAGTMFCMWLGEKITDRGLGNGVSLIIMAGIIARLPGALVLEFQSQVSNNRILGLVLEMALLFFVVLLTILIVQGVRRIPIQFAKKMVGRGVSDVSGAGNRDFIPLKVNASGVMPIIFAQALMFLPATLIQYTAGQAGSTPTGLLRALNDFTSPTYNIVYFLLIVVFTYVYTALIVNPGSYSEYLKRNNAFIPGVKPGTETTNFIDTITTRITLPGACFLGLIAILPAIAAAFGVNTTFALFYGGTTMLIMVGVILDTLQMIESHLLVRKYDGLVKSGRIVGRTSSMQGIGTPGF